MTFSGSILTPRSAVLSWQAPLLEDRNGIIISYTINLTSLNTGLTQQLISTTTNLTLTNLAPFTTYTCIIAASTAIGLGPFSNTINIQTPETGKSNKIFFLACHVSFGWGIYL